MVAKNYQQKNGQDFLHGTKLARFANADTRKSVNGIIITKPIE